MPSLEEPFDRSDDVFQPGNKVGRYRLLGPLGAGGMAHIWAARNEQNRFTRTIVLKVIRSEFASDEEYRRMLVDEATAAAAIHHPNICEVFELGSHCSTLFIAMEWVAGDALSGLLRGDPSRRALPLPLAARVIANACSGLHAAHEATGPDGAPLNIVHRDVSPQNILLSVSGQVKVSDFGIAKARDQLHARTRTGNIKGKFAYIPPEQVRGTGLDRRADIYAMGAVLYVAATGTRPFGSGAQAALSRIIKGDFARPTQVVAGFPENLEGIILKALAYHPEQRYQTADELRLALENWLADEGELVTATDVARAVKARLSAEATERIRVLKMSPETLHRMTLASKPPGDGTPTHPTASPIAGIPTPGGGGPSARIASQRPPTQRPPARVSQRPSTRVPASVPAPGDEVPTHRPPATRPQEGTLLSARWYERFVKRSS